MSKLVYFLGAGASFGKRDKEAIIEGLPIISEFTKEFDNVIEQITKIEFEHYKNRLLPSGESCGHGVEFAREMLINDLNWLKVESSRHATIDTYAKKLYLTDRRVELNKLEKVLAIFLMIEQIIYKGDSRYDTFLASILNENRQIPNDIVILTWNYDSQFEIAFKEYRKEVALPEDVGVRYLNQKIEDRKVAPRIFKLNGSASFNNMKSLADTFDNVGLTEELLFCILDQYIKEDSSDLTFAWDKQMADKRTIFLEEIETAIADVTDMVVIGYSFPFFNRNVDRELFNKMTYLSNIYIQDKTPENIIDNIKAVKKTWLRKPSFIPVRNLDQFFLPPSL